MTPPLNPCDAASGTAEVSAGERARFVRDQMPAGGLFAGHEWRVSPAPFPLGAEVAGALESLGRVLLQFYRAVNLLYRRSAEGKEPDWVARGVDIGKPAELIALQRHPAFKNQLPRVIRPDLLLTERGLCVTELDSVPGGIGLTAWLNRTYSELGLEVLGGPEGMLRGFEGIFGEAPAVHLVVSEEAATYRPEMAWMAEQLGGSRFKVQDAAFEGFADGDAVYRFLSCSTWPTCRPPAPFSSGRRPNRLRVTAPPKPMLEEKMLLALLWNRNLRGFWRRELGEGFFERLLGLAPYTWLVDPAPAAPARRDPGVEPDGLAASSRNSPKRTAS